MAQHGTTQYTAPVADMEFVLDALVDLTSLSKLDGYQHADPETVAGVLAEAGRFFAEVIAPTNRVGDLEGAVLEDGTVRTPAPFKEAYRRYVDAGWAGVHLPERWGGGGFPYAVGIALQEMFKSANMALSLCPLLTQASIEALVEHGSPEQQELHLEKLVTGEWAGTMCLTEPQAGSDVGALTTRAVPADDGTYRLTGQKIFITWGDQDLTDNIVHLVLARTPGAAPGTKGISLFVVPKFLPSGERNTYEIVSIEHKLGIHGSPTCVIAFEGAVGELVGEEQQGMRYMFTMMNTARIGVGIEGLAIAERAFQMALAHARERRQGRAVGADPGHSSLIAEHPDVRRMLVTIKAHAEAMRAFLYTTAATLDVSEHADDAGARAEAASRVALLTPIAKAWCTDLGVEMASLALQVHGGMGYVEETGVAQLFRDSRIAPIYEGTNGIQAVDLVLRKLPLDSGGVVSRLLDEIAGTLAETSELDELSEARDAVATALEAARDAVAHLSSRLAKSQYDDAMAGATPFLRLMGTLLGGWLMVRSGAAAVLARRAGEGDPAFLDGKLATATFFCTQVVPQAVGLLPAVEAGAAALPDYVT